MAAVRGLKARAGATKACGAAYALITEAGMDSSALAVSAKRYTIMTGLSDKPTTCIEG